MPSTACHRERRCSEPSPLVRARAQLPAGHRCCPCYPPPHAPYMPQGHSSAADGTVTTMASENQPQPAPNRNTKLLSSGWKALQQWGDDVARIEPLAGGVANDVWSVRSNGRLAVGRLGTRSDADLAWET